MSYLVFCFQKKAKRGSTPTVRTLLNPSTEGLAWVLGARLTLTPKNGEILTRRGGNLYV